MILISDELKLKVDLQAKQIVEKLEAKHTGKDVFVYYKYPIYRGALPEDLIQAHLLVTSPRFGVIYIACKVGEELDEAYYEYLESLDSNLYKKFVSRSELRKSKRELKFDVSGIVLSTQTREENFTREKLKMKS